MGALVSIPLAPIGLIGTWVSSFLGSAICTCCSSSSLNPLNHTFTSSVATRVMYATIFLVNSILSWCSLSHRFTDYLEHLSWGFFKVGNAYCREHGCTGFTNVQRFNFTLGLEHLILAGLLVGVNSTSNPRAVIQNGWWMSKIFVLWLFIFVSYFIPDLFFVIWGNYFSIVFSTVFIGIGLILLVDFAHEWAETCMEKIEEGEIYLVDDIDDSNQNCLEGTNFWRTLLVGGTLSMYIGVVIMTILMYIYFANQGCNMNQTVITINLVLVLLVTGVSLHPSVQEYNPNAGLAQASMCCVYCTYLVFSACLSEPDDKLCNPLVRSSGTRTITVIVGAVMTFAAVAYTTTRAAANSAFSHAGSNGNQEHMALTTQPSARTQMRYEALRQAVNEGSLPESVLDEEVPWIYNNEEGEDEEVHYTRYNYVLFHIIFFLATQYIAALLTINVVTNGGDAAGGDEGAFIPVGRTYFNTWLKIVSSWVCYVLYAWTLIAPMLFPDRFN